MVCVFHACFKYISSALYLLRIKCLQHEIDIQLSKGLVFCLQFHALMRIFFTNSFKVLILLFTPLLSSLLALILQIRFVSRSN